MTGMTFIAVSSQKIEEAFEKSLFAAKEQLLTDCNYFAREDQGTLIDSARAQQKGMELSISWNTPYAKRVYYTGTPSKAVNPNASLMWAEKAATKDHKDWERILEKGMTKSL